MKGYTLRGTHTVYDGKWQFESKMNKVQPYSREGFLQMIAELQKYNLAYLSVAPEKCADARSW